MSRKYIDIWFHHGTRNISIINYKRPWKSNNIKPIFGIRTNGAKRKRGDVCLDFSIYLGYLVFNYTDFDLQRCICRKGKNYDKE